MTPTEVARAAAAAISTVSALGLRADDAVPLHNSNRLTVRLLPCDLVARVAPIEWEASAAFEVEVAQQLAAVAAPIAGLDPRVEPGVYVRGGFAINFWSYRESGVAVDVTHREYAQALERLHAGMRQAHLAAPHFTDRVAEAERLVANRADSPALVDADRELLSSTLRNLTRAILDRGAPEQLLHGEPHPGNLLRTKQGLLFIDLETCCRGPVELDLAHCAPFHPARDGTAWHVDPGTPAAVSEHYEHADQGLVRDCWVLMLAMVAAWRCDRRDQFPDGRRMGADFVDAIRSATGSAR